MKKIRLIKNGFTLVELLIIIAFVGLLSAFLFSSYSSVQLRTRDTQRKNDLKQIQTALELYRQDYGRYPYFSGMQAGNWLTISRPGPNCPNAIYGTPTTYCYTSAICINPSTFSSIYVGLPFTSQYLPKVPSDPLPLNSATCVSPGIAGTYDPGCYLYVAWDTDQDRSQSYYWEKYTLYASLENQNDVNACSTNKPISYGYGSVSGSTCTYFNLGGAPCQSSLFNYWVSSPE